MDNDATVIHSTNKELEEELRKIKIKNSTITVCEGQDESFYHMRHARRGKALIFNQEKFLNLELMPRNGTDKDALDLEKVLSRLRFDVQVYKDKKLGFIRRELKEVANEDHTESDCILGKSNS